MKMNLQALIGLVLLGCNSSIKVDEVQTEEIVVDVDQDGFDSTVDCDDFDLAVHPGAQEFCDGIDNNCDGQVDEGVSRQYYRDLDGDGFGDDNESLIACNAPENYIIVGNDCDDSSATSFPGAPEICDERDNDCDGDVDEYLLDGLFLDVDGDGYGDPAHPIDNCADDLTRYARNQLDCDDSNPEIHYDALEICDEIDNDCDGAVDEPGSGAQLWYADTDGDGYGNLLSSVYACERPLGYTSDSQDCDDSSDTTYPTADEHCNLKDDDCDGFVDENPVDPYTFYLDADSDGFGDSLFTTVACNQPIGYVSNNLDCNDTTSAISPNAPEICNQTDNNCNGIPDDNAIGAATYYADVDGDTFGDINDQIHSCTPIAGRVLNSLDCDDGDPAQNPLSIETCNGEDDNCNGNTDENAIDASVWYLDADGDSYGTLTLWTTACTQPSGYVDNVLDCNDADALHNPDTPEVCNGLDDNCNNQVDEGLALLSWYFDDDGDGFGNPWIVVDACTQPVGMIANNQDCDDLDAQHNPNSPEICNGLDDNCNNQVDEGLSRSPWYFDDDGDGFGNPWIVVEDCSQPAGMIEDNQDCNDLDPEIHPDADEVCGDGLDNNCDGRFDDETAIDAYSGYLDLDGDGYGGGEWDSSCEDIYYTLNEDCDDGDPDVNPDGNEVCDGIDNDCDGNADSAALCPCNFETNNGSNYLFCKSNRTWSVAKGECAQYGYHLVTINDATENTWLDGRVDSYSSTRWWTGYNDITVEDYWDWDGPYSTYTNWANNEPNNATSTVGTTTGDEDCVVLNQTSNGTWNDLNCLNSLYFVCEANP